MYMYSSGGVEWDMLYRLGLVHVVPCMYMYIHAVGVCGVGHAVPGAAVQRAQGQSEGSHDGADNRLCKDMRLPRRTPGGD